MKFALIAAAGMAALGAPALSQTLPEDLKINQLIVYGDDPCPASTDDEIIVCARKPDSERYRIPENLRDDPNDPAGRSWAERATEMNYVGRSGIGSCSPVGPGGFTGCLNQFISQAKAERAAGDDVNWARLIEEARQERLARIDAEAEALDQELREAE